MIPKQIYWIFYIILTSAVVLILVTIPGRFVDSTLEPIELDAAATAELLFNRVTAFDPPFGSQYGEDAVRFEGSPVLSLSRKRFAYRVSVPETGQEWFNDKMFYDKAAPLAPIAYDRFVYERPFIMGGHDVTVIVDLVYPRDYRVVQ